MDINNYLWYPYLKYQQECRENGKEDSIQEWLELTGKVVSQPVQKPQEKRQESTVKTKRVRNRNAKGHYVKDDPNTPENEAWKVIKELPILKSKSKRKRRKKA